MRISEVGRPAIIGCSAIAMLAGCSGRGSQMSLMPLAQPPNATASQTVRPLTGPFGLLADRRITSGRPIGRSSMDPASVGRPLLFVSDYSSGAVDIYRQTGKNKMVGQITGLLAGGLATDRAANLYVLNFINFPSSDVTNLLVYAPPYTGPPKSTIDDGNNSGEEVAVDSSGVVAVANLCTNSCASGGGSVTLYSPNSTTPCVKVTDPSFVLVESAAFDRKGDLFIDGSGPKGAVVGRIKGRCHAKTVDVLSTGNVIVGPAAIRIDKADRIAIADCCPESFAPPIIYAYGHPKMRSLGDPVSTTVLSGSAWGGAPDAFAFVASGTHAYVADTSDTFVSKYAFPAGGSATKTIPFNGGPFGIAVTPALVP